jgi:histidinol-phosphate aminotransferase
MPVKNPVSRRGFVGGVAAAIGYLGLKPGTDLWAEPGTRVLPFQQDEYDSLAKLANNENPYGPPESVMKAMTKAMKYANRYGYPDGDIHEAIAKHHGVQPENVLMAAGGGEILNITGQTFLKDGLKVLGVEPSYTNVYQYATSIRSDAIKLPLLPDFNQDIPAMIKAARTWSRDIGFVYLVNPNNPTGRIVTAKEIRQLLDGLPEGMPVLIDEAYHHFVDDPAYATSIPYVLEGRPVIILRTFSKIVGLAGMRLGYAVAPRPLIQKMRPEGTGTINALVKWGGVAALQDNEAQAKVKRLNTELRNKTTADLNALGYATVPSEANFFLVHLKRPVQPVIAEFRKKGVLVGRPFPPLTEHLRVSVGSANEMDRFMVAFKEIFTSRTAATGAKSG